MELNSEYYRKHARKAIRLSEKGNKQRVVWLRQLLFLESAVFGFQVAFYSNLLGNVGLFYLLALAILGLSILVGVIAAYIQVWQYMNLHRKYKAEVLHAIRQQRELENISGDSPMFFLFAEKTCFVCFAVSVVLFVLSFVF